MVFNGNGRAGAAGTAASRIHGLGYAIAGTPNARRQDYATSVVMYRPGFRAEGIRLAKDLRIKVVGPLDGDRGRCAPRRPGRRHRRRLASAEQQSQLAEFDAREHLRRT